jgi:hypothetical protein
MNQSQLELFSQSSKGPLNLKTEKNSRFLSYIWTYEKTILTIIGFIITGVISFSMGVEQGKGSISRKNNYNFDIAKQTQAPLAKEDTRQEPAIKETEKAIKIMPAEGIITKSPAQLENYTIQVASYRTTKHAQNEVEALRRKGLSSSVLPKGDYVVVCVGKFSDKKTAKSLLTELKKQYQDCFVRRL